MRIFAYTLFCVTLLCLSGCSDSAQPVKTEDVRVVPAGEKATIGHLTYNVVDSQILNQLGDPAAPRVPHERFITVQVAVTNSSNVDNPIPAIELLSDSGKTYDELTDGTGVPNWLGIIRHVGAGQTERGDVVFDAPAAHYKLKFSDESTDNEVLADLPLSYTHERMDDVSIPTADLPGLPAPTGSQKPK
jgi:hypothetical protein